MYVLYYFPFSQHSRRVVSLLVEAQLEHELRLVAMADGQHRSPEYLTVNPNHQVPTLVDGDVKIHESNAILRYLCLKHGLTQWLPEKLDERAKVEQWLDWNQCRLSPAVVDIVFNTVFMRERGDQAAIARGKERLAELEPILESGLRQQRFLAGDQPTIADLSVASNVFQLSLARTVLSGSHTKEWYERVGALRGFQQSLPAA